MDEINRHDYKEYDYLRQLPIDKLLALLAVDDPFLRTFSASYTDGEGCMSIDIMSYEGEPITQVQKTDDQ